jgi:hypothetical protein
MRGGLQFNTAWIFFQLGYSMKKLKKFSKKDLNGKRKKERESRPSVKK